MELGDSNILQIIDGDRGVNYPKKSEFSKAGYCLFLNTKNVCGDGFKFDEPDFISKEADLRLRKGKLQRYDVVLTTRGTVGNVGIFDDSVRFENIRINSGMVILRPVSKRLLPHYIFKLIQSDIVQERFKVIFSGTAQPQLPIRSMVNIKIPLPSLETQKQLVSEAGKEQEIINANKQLIEIYEQKIADVLSEI